jgi:multidrug resistance protein
MKKYAVPSLLLMIVLVAFPQISETIYTPSLPDIAAALGVTNSSVQFTLSIYFIGFALGVFCWGWLSDLIGRRPAMLGGLIVYGIGSLMCFYSESIQLLLIGRFVQAFGAATGSIITQTMLRESVSGDRRHAMFAQISAVIAFTPAVGPLIGGWIDQTLGFRWVFLALVLISALLFIYAFLKLPETTNVSLRSKVAILPVVKKMLATLGSSLSMLSNLLQIICMLTAMFVLLIGAGIALPNCISLALVHFQDVIGTAGAIFSLGYYLLVSLTTWGMGALHNGSLLMMPLYFLIISGVMWLLGKRFISEE